MPCPHLSASMNLIWSLYPCAVEIQCIRVFLVRIWYESEPAHIYKCMYTRIGSDPLLMSITRELCVTIFILVRGILKGAWFSQFRYDDCCDEGKYGTSFSCDSGTRIQVQHKINLVGSNSNASGLHPGSDGTSRLFIDIDFPVKYFVVFVILSRKIPE